MTAVEKNQALALLERLDKEAGFGISFLAGAAGSSAGITQAFRYPWCGQRVSWADALTRGVGKVPEAQTRVFA